MSITSFPFIWFAVAVVLAYFIVPKRIQWIVVLTANIVFYCASGLRFLLYILISSLISWYLAIKLDKVSAMGTTLANAADSQELKRKVRSDITSIKKLICGFAIVVPLGIWIVIKYGNFFIENLNIFLKLIGKTWTKDSLSIAMPLGISFYTFHMIGYVVDIYRRKYPAEHNFFKYFTFVTYFPHIVQGPFSRFDELGKSIFEEHQFLYDRLCQGCARILWGLVKKLVIADTLGVHVTDIFNNYSAYTGVHLILAFFGYSIQLYADFSGYMDIVCGLSHILGINLAENFKQPYFARSVEEFWRRWHITLGKWFKDYVFMPISMGSFAQKIGRKARSKWGPKMGKLVPGYFALIFVWTATGLWHGASWTYLVWGYLNLFIIISTMQLGSFYEKIKTVLHIKSESWWWQLLCIIRTFCLVSFFRFFSTTNDLRTAVSMAKYASTDFRFHDFAASILSYLDSALIDWYLIGGGIVFMIIVDVLKEVDKWDTVKEKCPFVFRDCVYVALIMLLILFAGGDNDLLSGFMYANF